MKKLILLAILFSFLPTTYNFAQTKEIQKVKFQDNYQKAKELVKTRHFSFVGEMVYNNKKRERLNSDSNTIVINKSEVSGSVISLISDNKTFDVTGTIVNYKTSFDDDKEQISITINIKTSTQMLDMFIDIKSEGNAFLTVSTGNYNTISWTGKLKN